MDIHALHTCFVGTLDPNIETRTNAERQLQEGDKKPGFINACLDIVVEPQVNNDVRRSAAIYLKNKVSKAWDPPEDPTMHRIDHDEKPVFRERLIPAIVTVSQTSPQVRTQLVSCLRTIINNDKPEQWPQLMDVTLKLLSSGDITSAHAGLTCLLEIARFYRWTSGDARRGLDSIITIAFPGVLSMGNSLVNEQDNAAGEMLHTILKIYKMATYFEFPLALQEQDSLVGWVGLFLQIVKKPLPSAVMDLEVDERELHPWVKCKKWAFANPLRLFSRYARKVKEGLPEFKALFLTRIVPEILAVYFEQVEAWVQGQLWLGQSTLYKLLGFFEECVLTKSTWELVRPQLQSIISHVVFPLLCPTDEDLETFTDDPEEYLHKQIDEYEDVLLPSQAAASFLTAVVGNRRTASFTFILQFVQTIIQEHQQNPADLQLSRKKEGALRMLGYISNTVLSKKSPIVNQMEGFVVQYVLPDLNSPHGFLRARACEFLNRYAEAKFQSEENLSLLYQGIMQCLNDENLPVQIEAALALQPLISHQLIHDALSARIPEVMTHLLQLADRVDLDALSGVLEDFVEVFGKQLQPFALQLAQQLVNQFMRLGTELIESRKSDPDDSVDPDKAVSAAAVLDTLITLIMTLDNSAEIMSGMEEALLPVFTLILQNNMVDCFVEACNLAYYITMSATAISPIMWQVHSMIHHMLQSSDVYYIDLTEAEDCLSNFISRGGAGFANGDNMEQLYLTIAHFMTNDNAGAQDRISASTLAVRALTALRGSIDGYMPKLIDLAVGVLRHNEHEDGSLFNMQQIYLLNTIIGGVYYHAQGALTYLEYLTYTETFFRTWFEKLGSFERVFDKKLTILALLAIISLPNEQLPPTIAGNVSQLSKGLVSVMAGLPEAVAKREKFAKQWDEVDNSFASGPGEEEEDGDEWADEDEEGEEGDLSDAYEKFLASAGTDYDDEYDDYDDELEEDLDETPLDPINAYVQFRDVLMALSQQHQERYATVTRDFTDDDRRVVETTFQLAQKTTVAPK